MRRSTWGTQLSLEVSEFGVAFEAFISKFLTFFTFKFKGMTAETLCTVPIIVPLPKWYPYEFGFSTLTWMYGVLPFLILSKNSYIFNSLSKFPSITGENKTAFSCSSNKNLLLHLIYTKLFAGIYEF